MNGEPKIENYLGKEEFKKIKEFSKNKKTPFLVLNLAKVGKKYDELKENFPYAKIYYAIKANPNERIIGVLDKKGSNFDIATIYEMDQLLSQGISPDRMSYGNTIKKEEDIEYAYKKGIRLFATDSKSDLEKIARKAPGSRVFFRLLTESSGADWPLSRKFGSHPDIIYELIFYAKKLGLNPYGLSFHVGSQQRDIGQWDNAIAQCKYLFDATKEKGIALKMINIGGGFPASYIRPTHSLKTYAQEITRFLKEDFGENLPDIVLEPGRYMAAEAGVIVTEVIMVSRKARLNQYNWVYIDVGKFGGLIETMDESIKYPIFTSDPYAKKKRKEVILAGPTCDSMDILYEDFKYTLPEDVKEGDRLYILSTGAYTQTYCSVYFNGFPPLIAYIME